MLGRGGRAGAAVTHEPAGDPVPPPDLLSSLDASLCCPGPLAKSSALGCTALPSLPGGRKCWNRSLVGEKGREKKGERLCGWSSPGQIAETGETAQAGAAGWRRSTQLRREGALAAGQP